MWTCIVNLFSLLSTCSHNLAPLRLLCFSFCIRLDLASGIKRIHQDLEPLKLPLSALSASSVYKNQPEYQAHKADLNVFASQEQSSGAWCPAQTVQNQLSEWLQIEFDTLKIMRVLFTEGRGGDQNAFVPAFLLRYQRLEGHRWYDYRMRNGTKLLYANHNSQTIAITLDPPIVAKRFRLYPYNELEPRFMCLRLAVYGLPFNDGLIEYVIPEGGVYRMDPRNHVALNDTSYDGSWILPDVTPTAGRSTGTADRRAYFYGGLGLLTDKYYYEGQLLEQGVGHKVVGWFRRQHSNPSDRITMLFTFDQVRNFTQMRIHTLNSLDYVAVFRRVAVQFSLSGQYYDKHNSTLVLDLPRDTQNRHARWVSVELGNRIGRFVRVSLWFDYDWIVLSEVTFESVPVTNLADLPMVNHTGPLQQISELETTDVDQPDLSDPNFQILSPQLSSEMPTAVRLEHDIEPFNDQYLAKQSDDTGVHSVSRSRSNNTPYIVAILCCCLGSMAFATLFAFMVYRLRRRHRHKRSTKLPKGSPMDGTKQQQQFLLANAHQNSNFYSPTFNAAHSGFLSPDSNHSTALPPSFQYNPLKPAPTGLFGHANPLEKSDCRNVAAFTSPESSMSVPLVGSHAVGSSPNQYPLADSMTSPGYKHFAHALNQDGMLTLQFIQHGTNVGPFGGVTLTRRGLPDSCDFTPYPFVTLSSGGIINLGMSSSHNVTANNTPAKLSFCPPPPPDQPLPPLPPPSTSPDSTQHTLLGDTSSNGLLLTGALSSVMPYAASYPATSFMTESGLVFPFDGSMPEYASASLFSGNGSIQPGLGHAPMINSINSKCSSVDPEVQKSRGTSETYCIPHQNGIHHHLGPWPTDTQHQLPNGLNILSPITCTTFPVSQGPNSDGQTGSLDSSGMYYLTNPHDSIPLGGISNFPLSDFSLQPSTLFVPFSSTAHLSTFNGMSVIPEKKQDTAVGCGTRQPDLSESEVSVNGHLINFTGSPFSANPHSSASAVLNGMDCTELIGVSASEGLVKLPATRKPKLSTDPPVVC